MMNIEVEGSCSGRWTPTETSIEDKFIIAFKGITIVLVTEPADSCEGCVFDGEQGCLTDALSIFGIDCVLGCKFVEEKS